MADAKEGNGEEGAVWDVIEQGGGAGRRYRVGWQDL